MGRRARHLLLLHGHSLSPAFVLFFVGCHLLHQPPQLRVDAPADPEPGASAREAIATWLDAVAEALRPLVTSREDRPAEGNKPQGLSDTPLPPHEELEGSSSPQPQETTQAKVSS